VIVFIANKYKIHLAKYMTILLSAIFIILSVYCTFYDYNTPVVEIMGTNKNPVVLVSYKGETVLVGAQKKKYIDDIKGMMEKHNKKQLDMLVVTKINSKTIQEIINIYDNFGKAKICFCDLSPKIFEDVSQSNVNGFSIDETVNVFVYDSDYMVITVNGQRLFITDSQNTENIFEKAKECDIIIKYGKNVLSDNGIKQNKIQVFELTEGKRLTVAF
jgi:hypothetical protein